MTRRGGKEATEQPVAPSPGAFRPPCIPLQVSEVWVNKFKSLNEHLEILARQQAELAIKHKWAEMKKLQPADQLIVKIWNPLPVTYHTLQRVCIAVLAMFSSTYA